MTLPYKKDNLAELAESITAKGERKDKQTGTNCEGFSVTFHKGDKTVRLFMKKTFLKKGIEEHETDYKLLKETFGNIVPNTVYIKGADGQVFSFSEPVVIEFDVFEKKNERFLKEVLVKNRKFREQIIFFLKKFRELKEIHGKTLDIIGGENLVYADGGKLKYIDSFIPFHEFNKKEKEIEEKIQYLEDCLSTTEFFDKTA